MYFIIILSLFLETFLSNMETESCPVNMKIALAQIESIIVTRSLLEMISEANSAIDEGDTELALHLSTTVQDLVWEKLNIGHWSTVDENWRKLYYVACFVVALSHLRTAHPSNPDYGEVLKRCLKWCDMGLMMGREVSNVSASKLATDVHTRLRNVDDESTLLLLDYAKIDPVIAEPPEMDDKCSLTVENKLDRSAFTSRYCRANESSHPVVINNVATNWKALQKWSVEFFVRNHGFRLVPIELGSSYAEDNFQQKLMTINEYVRRCFLDANSTQRGYLAQHRLLEQIPELYEDIALDNYLRLCGHESSSSLMEEVDFNVWFGPAGTISPLHFDPRHNLFTQVIGRKYVRIYAPAHTHYVYPRDDLMSNTSRVDVENPDYEQFPKFRNAPYLDYILHPGQTLFIPARHWHYVRALDVSCSVSCWFGSNR